jgi:tRNA (guanosine-2'-O-)-methyltransferase
MITDKRHNKIKQVVAHRQLDLIMVLENVNDPHNIGAVIRSCDAVGIHQIHIIYSEEGLYCDNRYVGKRSSRGALKWSEVVYHTSLEKCMNIVRPQVSQIVATHLGESAKSVYETDFTQSTAFLFGNEKDGLSKQALAYADHNIIIPMHGMVQSLNISVACAVTIFEAQRQRMQAGQYINASDNLTQEKMELYDEYLAISKPTKEVQY